MCWGKDLAREPNLRQIFFTDLIKLERSLKGGSLFHHATHMNAMVVET